MEDKVTFSMMDYENRLERDFDGDGNFEIITQTSRQLQQHRPHRQIAQIHWVPFHYFPFSIENTPLTSVFQCRSRKTITVSSKRSNPVNTAAI